MIDINKSIEEFKKYSNKYDMNNKNIERKYYHSFRVMHESKYIAENLKLSQEQIDLATLIGLLHDIARFEQMKKYGTFRDVLSIDHGNLGAIILVENNLIRKFVKDNKYDDIIITAIRNHNKHDIEEGLNEEKLLQAKIIRDADKLDIFYESTEFFCNDPEKIDEIYNLKIRYEYFKKIIQKKSIKRQKDQNSLEDLLVFIAFIFNINYNISLKKIAEKDYINKILNKFSLKEEDTIEKMKQVKKIVNEYVQV